MITVSSIAFWTFLIFAIAIIFFLYFPINLAKLKLNKYVYVDDHRTPKNKKYLVLRDYDNFVRFVEKYGLDDVKHISLDHDLDNTASTEYFSFTRYNGKINYDRIEKKTGYHCALFLVDYAKKKGIDLPLTTTHTHNPVGAGNITSVINLHQKLKKQKEFCIRKRIPIKKS